jgi:hypothetical protein
MYFARRAQLAISTKSLMSNVSGSIPNRTDDAMGESVNVHAHDPGMVLGYLFVVDGEEGSRRGRDGRTGIDVLAERLLSFSGRRSERDAQELFEAAALVVSTPTSFTFHPALLGWDDFLNVLLGQVRVRNPLFHQEMVRVGH